MRRRLIPLPPEGRKADIARLMKQRAELVKDRKSTAIVDRRLRLARAHQMRREVKQERRAS